LHLPHLSEAKKANNNQRNDGPALRKTAHLEKKIFELRKFKVEQFSLNARHVSYEEIISPE